MVEASPLATSGSLAQETAAVCIGPVGCGPAACAAPRQRRAGSSAPAVACLPAPRHRALHPFQRPLGGGGDGLQQPGRWMAGVGSSAAQAWVPALAASQRRRERGGGWGRQPASNRSIDARPSSVVSRLPSPHCPARPRPPRPPTCPVSTRLSRLSLVTVTSAMTTLLASAVTSSDY